MLAWSPPSATANRPTGSQSLGSSPSKGEQEGEHRGGTPLRARCSPLVGHPLQARPRVGSRCHDVVDVTDICNIPCELWRPVIGRRTVPPARRDDRPCPRQQPSRGVSDHPI